MTDRTTQTGSWDKDPELLADTRGVLPAGCTTVRQRQLEAGYDQVATYYDRCAERWDQIANRAVLEQWRTLVRHSVPPGSSVLDVGVGTGRSVRLLLSETTLKHIIGLDRSWGMLMQASKKFPVSHIELIQGDALQLPFPNDAFDVVTSVWVLETLPDPLRALQEMLRVVRADGLVMTLFSSRPVQGLQRSMARLLERIARPQLRWTFLPEESQPLSACTLRCTQRMTYGLNTIATFGKSCRLPASSLTSSTRSGLRSF